jgi:hypothetical protein
MESRGALYAVFRCAGGSGGQVNEATLVLVNPHSTQFQGAQLLKPFIEKYREYTFELKRATRFGVVYYG